MDQVNSPAINANTSLASVVDAKPEQGAAPFNQMVP